MNRHAWIRAATLATLLLFLAGLASAATRLPVYDGIGGEFTAPSTLGFDVSLSDYRGKVVLLSFGYTNCTDVCPVTFMFFDRVMATLGPDAGSVQVMFVTVDPEADTVEHLRNYVARHDPGYVGISASAAQTAALLEQYRAEAELKATQKVTTRHHRFRSHASEAHLISHSQQVYLIDTRGRVRGLLNVGTPVANVRDQVRELLAE